MRVTGILLLVVAMAAHAEVYKSINADGEVVYSDRPTQGAERVKMPPLPSYTPQPVRTLSRSAATVEQQVRYESFIISSPASDATIRNNLGTVEVDTRLAPALMTSLGHRIQFYLDGVAHGNQLDNTTLTLSNVERGEHRLSASVVDTAGNVLITTAETTVYVKRASKLLTDKQGSVTDNPGYITDNPNIVGDETFQPYRRKDIADYSGQAADNDDPDEAELPANPGFRNRNPNILSPNPNILSPNPNLINPPQPKKD
jgi:hypothetical protein